MRFIAFVGSLLALSAVLAFMALRVIPAYEQCYAPAFAHSAACFTHDVLTGEDL